MIAKEWRDARWKLLIAAIPVLYVALLRSVPSPFSENVEIAQSTSDSATYVALRNLSDVYVLGSFAILIPLAAFLGITMFSVESGNGSILTLISRPASRTRILLTKYVVGAGILLSAAVTGKALLLGLAAWRGNPVGEISLSDTVLSTLLMWIGVLSVLGIAMLISVLTRNLILSIGICAVVLFLYLGFGGLYGEFSQSRYYPPSLNPTSYWISANYFLNSIRSSTFEGGYELTSFIVCMILAVLPLLAALWLFERKKF